MKLTSKPLIPCLCVLILSVVTSSTTWAQETITGELTISSGGIQDASSTNNFEYRPNGILIDRGVGSGSLLSSDQGGETEFLWYPAKLALRAGGAYTTEFDDTNIGYGSTVIGLGSTATSQADIALGWYDHASGGSSVAMGNSNSVSGGSAVSIGMYNNATGGVSVALGYECGAYGSYAHSMGIGTVASNWGAEALGGFTTASGPASMSTGYNTLAAGFITTTFGESTSASGDEAVAFGQSSAAWGCYSASFGYYTSATACASVTFGQYNVGGGTVQYWIPTDPLMELGNGTDASHPSDAFIVYKNGNATFQGVVMLAPGGDIPMFGGS